MEKEVSTLDEVIKVTIKPVTKLKFSGVSSYSKTQTVFCGAEMDQAGLYRNGLTSQQEKEYEKLLNLEPGKLNKKSDFWGSLEIRLNNDKPTHFAFSGLMDALKLGVIKAHSKIGNSELDASKPGVLFFIDDPETKAGIEAAKIDFELTAIEHFQEMSIEEKRSLLRLFGKQGIDNMSETMIKTELFKKLKDNPKQFVDYYKDPSMKVRALLEECIEKRILTKRGAYYYNGEDLIGNSTDETIGYLSDVRNQTIKLSLEQKVKKARK